MWNLYLAIWASSKHDKIDPARTLADHAGPRPATGHARASLQVHRSRHDMPVKLSQARPDGLPDYPGTTLQVNKNAIKYIFITLFNVKSCF
jgi:hypothetical protein